MCYNINREEDKTMRYLSDNQFEELQDRVREIKDELHYINDGEDLEVLVNDLEKAVNRMDEANTWNGTRLVQQ